MEHHPQKMSVECRTGGPQHNGGHQSQAEHLLLFLVYLLLVSFALAFLLKLVEFAPKVAYTLDHGDVLA